MKKKLFILAAALCFVTGASAQNRGVTFIEGSFASVLKAAQAAGKPIFLDIYTTWCKPCKYMTSTIFTSPVAGDYMNANFVNAKFDAEAGEGIEIARRYNVLSYPTMLILDSRGNQLSRLESSSPTPEAFVERLKAAAPSTSGR